MKFNFFLSVEFSPSFRREFAHEQFVFHSFLPKFGQRFGSVDQEIRVKVFSLNDISEAVHLT